MMTCQLVINKNLAFGATFLSKSTGRFCRKHENYPRILLRICQLLGLSLGIEARKFSIGVILAALLLVLLLHLRINTGDKSIMIGFRAQWWR